jgi:hypothetical protein
MGSLDEVLGLKSGIAKLDIEIGELERTLRLTRPTSVGSRAVSKIIEGIERCATVREGFLQELGRQEPSLWRGLYDRFQALARHEAEIVHATRKEFLLADCEFNPEINLISDGPYCLLPTFEPTAILELRNGPDEQLKAEFETVATEAGIVLGHPTGAQPLKFWLYSLFVHLRRTESHHLFAPTLELRIGDDPRSEMLKPLAGRTFYGAGGLITNVCKASANFCLWLERKALEQAESLRAQNNTSLARTVGSKSTAASKVVDPELAKRRALVKNNPDATASELCEIFDRQRVPLPPKWQAAGVKSWAVGYRNAQYRSRLDVMISKDRRED